MPVTRHPPAVGNLAPAPEAGAQDQNDSMDRHRDGPRSKLTTYDGTTEWESFVIPFERMAEEYGWLQHDHLNALFECLHGSVMRYLCTLSTNDCLTNAIAQQRLQMHFGMTDPLIALRSNLHSLQQGRESPEEFAEEIT